jgi:WD40 repeat protein
VQQLRFSPNDGTLLAIAGGGQGAGVEIWDVSTSSRVALLPTSEDLHGLAMAPGSKMLAFGQSSSLTLWAVVDPMAQKQLAGLARPLSSIAFSPRGEMAVATIDNEVRRWSPDRCPTTARVATSVHASAVAFDAAGRLLAPGRDQAVWVSPDNAPVARVALPESWDWQSGRNNLMPTAFGIAQSADGRSFVIIRPRGPRGELLLGRLGADGSPGPIVRLELPDQPRPDRPPGPPPSDRIGTPPPPPRSGDGMGFRPGMFRRVVAVGPDGSRLFFATPSPTTDEASVSAWPVVGNKLGKPLWSITARFPTLALSPDGRTLAIGDRTGVVLLVDAETGQIRHRLEPPDVDTSSPTIKDVAWVHSLAFAPDGYELAVGTRDQVRLWSLVGAVPRSHVRLPGHRGQVLMLAYDPRGGLLASGGEDKLVKVWDLHRVRDELTRLSLD